MNTTPRTFLIACVIFAAAVVFTVAGCSKKDPAPTAAPAETAAAGVPEQTTCPVMGGAINKDLFIEYEGRTVYFCCPGCEAEFLKDPDKYLKKLPQFQDRQDNSSD